MEKLILTLLTLMLIPYLAKKDIYIFCCAFFEIPHQ